MRRNSEFTPRELQILQILNESPNCVFTMDMLTLAMYGDTAPSAQITVRTLVHRINKAHPGWIVNYTGVGYKLTWDASRYLIYTHDKFVKSRLPVDKQNLRLFRADGKDICYICGGTILSHDTYPIFSWTRILCDGSLVKV